MDLPKALKKKEDLVLEERYSPDQIQFTTYSSPVPNIKIKEISVPFGGQVYNISSLSRPAYEALSVKFLIDNGYKNYWILWKWLDLFNDNETSTTKLTEPFSQHYSDGKIILSNPMSDFTTTFSIFGIDEYNNKIIEFKYKQAFITSLSNIDFSSQAGDEITCTASFIFNRLEVNLLRDVDKSTC